MKNRFVLLLCAAIGCLTMTAPALAKECGKVTKATKAIKTKLGKPFKKLALPPVWKMEENQKSSIEFVHANKEDISFEIAVGKELKKNANLNALQNEVEAFIQKKADTIPLIYKSFNLKHDATVAAQEQDNMDPTVERKTFGKIEWLKFQSKSKIETTTTVGDKVEVSSKSTLETVYATFIHKQLYLVTFSVPTDEYEAHAPLFEITMQKICK